MTPSLGPALPGFTAARTAEQPAAPGKKDDAGFGKMVHGGASQTEKQPTAEAGARDPRWSKLAAGLAAQTGEDAPRRDDAIAAGPLPETTAAEAPGVEPKQAAPRLKSIADVQSSLRLEPGKPLSASTRVDVVSERSFPAPPQASMSQAALNVINAVAADSGSQQAFSTASATAQLGGPVAVPTHVLKIELHPAELGMVTAHLRRS